MVASKAAWWVFWTAERKVERTANGWVARLAVDLAVDLAVHWGLSKVVLSAVELADGLGYWMVGCSAGVRDAK